MTPSPERPEITTVTDPVTDQSPARAAGPLEASMPSVTDPVTAPGRPTRRCQTCGESFTPTRRDQRHCRARCRQRAYLMRRALAGHNPQGRSPRADTIYECPECLTRLLGEQRCEACNQFCRRIGPVGPCPHCDEPVALIDLIDPGRP